MTAPVSNLPWSEQFRIAANHWVDAEAAATCSKTPRAPSSHRRWPTMRSARLPRRDEREVSPEWVSITSA